MQMIFFLLFVFFLPQALVETRGGEDAAAGHLAAGGQVLRVHL